MTTSSLNSGRAYLFLITAALLVTPGCATRSADDDLSAAKDPGVAVASSPISLDGLALFDGSSPVSGEEKPAAITTSPEDVAQPAPATGEPAAKDIASTADQVVTVTVGDAPATATAVVAEPIPAPAPEPVVAIEKPLYDGPLPYTSEIVDSLVGSRLSVWSSTRNSYTYFIGRTLIAEYQEAGKKLAIRPDDAGASGLTCAWDMDNQLMFNTQKGAVKDSSKTCDRLTRQLVTALGTVHQPKPTPEELAAAAAAEAAAAAQAAQASAAAHTPATVKPLAEKLAPVAPLPTVVEIAKSRMTEHNLALWQSKDKTYNFFVGGLLDAEYSPKNETLTISSDGRGASALTCKYDAENSLWVKVDKQTNINDPEAVCDRLINELTSKLQR
ncbi:MAG: hypothetical protein FD165_1553 [Gammaproteobacteria bacterium]|nr:MAG: hypothetical protein FD165_1553 [Gammaproteobacteria bacterium]TND05466.1 MAG: hypothetical protein FD120_1074 [Gammaproteobacteria bacterium]